MERARIVVDGEVQGVGYRYFVARMARKQKVLRQAKNLEDGRVEIIVEGDKPKVKEFIERIQLREPPIYVESAEVAYEEPKGEFKSFKIISGEPSEEMVEGFSTGAAYLTTVRNELREFRGESRENFGALGDKIDQFREESNTNFQALDGKYYTVSEELGSINQNIAKLAESISKSNELLAKLIESYVEKRRKSK